MTRPRAERAGTGASSQCALDCMSGSPVFASDEQRTAVIAIVRPKGGGAIIDRHKKGTACQSGPTRFGRGDEGTRPAGRRVCKEINVRLEKVKMQLSDL